MKMLIKTCDWRHLLLRISVLGFTMIVGLSAVVITLTQLGQVRPARAGTLCVKSDGEYGCETSIGDALALAEEGDIVQVASGTYTENVFISQTITLQGGWAPDFSIRDLDTFSVTIRPETISESVVAIQGQFSDTSAVAPTLDGFIITGGRADLGSNHGGGLRIIDSDALVISNTIRDNSAFLLGGGVWVQRGDPILEGNQIMNNQSLGLGQEARGGGVQMENSGATLLSNSVVNNFAIGQRAFGGGVDIIGTVGISATLSGNTIQRNATDSTQPENGFGGGIAISGSSNSEVILINNLIFSNSASIDSSGQPESLGFGGAIAIINGHVRMEGSQVFSNTAASGGGIFIGGNLEDCCNLKGEGNLIQANTAIQGGGVFIGGMADSCCEFSSINTQIQKNNSQEGGGLYNSNQFVNLHNGLVFSNTAVTNGGGLFISAGASISVTNSATIANVAGQDGGAIHNSGQISVTNTTVSGNRATGMGGGIANFNAVNLANTTISDNTSVSGAGVFNSGTVDMVNSLIALNIGNNCLGVMNSLGHNLEDGGTCALNQLTDMSNTTPSIDPLGSNGGQTVTHALKEDSPAIDAGDNSACPAVDQRGVSRPVDGDGDGDTICDIGAFEYQINFGLYLPLVPKD
ncbi:MAG: choice-of-anchor Q domain-containing protein [Anaerolineales bacterium]